MNKITLDLIFIDFFNNLLFYNFLNIFKLQHLEYFKINFNILFIEGNFPHSFFSQYNYLSQNFSQLVDEIEILKLLKNNKIPLCLDLNNKNLQTKDLIDKYLLMILLTLNNKGNFIHCNDNNINELLLLSNLQYTFINDYFFETLNIPKINNEDAIYNFSYQQTQLNNKNNINLNKLDSTKKYRLMINDIFILIDFLLLPEYQFIFYKEYLNYEKEIYTSRIMGKKIDFNSFNQSL